MAKLKAWQDLGADDTFRIRLHFDIATSRRLLIKMQIRAGRVEDIILLHTGKLVFALLDLYITQNLFFGRVRDGFNTEVTGAAIGTLVCAPGHRIGVQDGGQVWLAYYLLQGMWLIRIRHTHGEAGLQ